METFDLIPATKGKENLEGVTIQAHMDMVCEEKNKTTEPYDWKTNGVKAIIEGNIIHSKDYKTSLGADNGIGLALCLALAKNHDKFIHGPIRILITADEEDGESGASMLKSETIKYDNIINLDWESANEICTACAGAYELIFDFTPKCETIVSSSYNPYCLMVSGLSGGHSALEINNRPSAIKIVAEILEQINCQPYIQKFVSTNAINSIANEARIFFFTAKELSYDLKNLEDDQKAKYLEKDLKIELLPFDLSNNSAQALSRDDSEKFLAMIKEIKFGVENSLENRQIASSGNIGPFIFEAGKNCNFSTLLRSCIEKDYEKMKNQNVEAVKKCFGEEASKYEVVVSPAWEYKENNNLSNLAFKCAKEQSINLSKTTTHGWLESGFFYNKRPNSEIISTGANLKDAHGINGEVEISSIKQLAKIVVSTLINISKK